MNIYICASFCYEDKKKTSERKYLIEKTVERLKKVIPGNNHYYLPHQLTIPNAWDISMEEWANAVYEHDMNELNKADRVIFLSFGKENNAGSVWEIGYVHGINTGWNYIENPEIKPKQVVMIKMTDEIESLMITSSLYIIMKEKEIETYDWTKMPVYRTELEKLS